MKKCIKCKETKEYSFFHKNKRQADGYFYYCKPCKHIVSKIEYTKNKDDYLRRCYDWRKTDKGKKSIALTYKKQKEKFPEKYKCRTILNSALACGKIVRPDTCSICNKKAKISGHHSDYSKPLDVIWCCYPCHETIHKK